MADVTSAAILIGEAPPGWVSAATSLALALLAWPSRPMSSSNDGSTCTHGPFVARTHTHTNTDGHIQERRSPSEVAT